MARDPLVIVQRLRKVALLSARRALADRTAAEQAVTAELTAHNTAVAVETEAYRALPAEERNTEIYAAWRGPVRATCAATESLLRLKEAETEAARDDVYAARLALRPIDAALERRAVRQQQAAGRKDQAALDEAGAARRPGR